MEIKKKAPEQRAVPAEYVELQCDVSVRDEDNDCRAPSTRDAWTTSYQEDAGKMLLMLF